MSPRRRECRRMQRRAATRPTARHSDGPSYDSPIAQAIVLSTGSSRLPSRRKACLGVLRLGDRESHRTAHWEGIILVRDDGMCRLCWMGPKGGGGSRSPCARAVRARFGQAESQSLTHLVGLANQETWLCPEFVPHPARTRWRSTRVATSAAVRIRGRRSGSPHAAPVRCCGLGPGIGASLCVVWPAAMTTGWRSSPLGAIDARTETEWSLRDQAGRSTIGSSIQGVTSRADLRPPFRSRYCHRRQSLTMILEEGRRATRQFWHPL